MILRLTIFACVLLAPVLNAPAAGAAARKPNILFVYTDDQRYDAFSAVQREQGDKGRTPWFKTPNMDRLAADGVRFRNAFVINSLCAPSRAVNLTGRYSHLNGVASNFRAFPLDNVTHATLLREAGYTTGYIGKWHMGNQRERPGFDFAASFIGHARYVDAPFVLNGEDILTKGWVDDVSTDYAVSFIKQQKDTGKPWSLVVGFKSPHGPCDPPERAKDRFAGERIRTVPNLHVPAPYMPEGAKNARAAATAAALADGAADLPVNLNYYRCVSAADDCFGRLLDTLDETGFADNTIVIYTSDNGYYLGEHGLGDKRSAYDESLRVPFIVRDPRLPKSTRGQVRDEMVLNLDLAQTILDFAGVPAPKEMQGQSWRALLDGPAAGWRKSWFYEYFAEKQKSSRVPDITAVRTDDAKLIHYTDHDEWTELFDLANDPFEIRNVYNDPAHAALRERVSAEYARLKQATDYRIPDYVDRPEWWGLPGGPDAPLLAPGVRLHYDFTKGPARQQVKDASPFGNDGEATGASAAPGRNGGKALRLDGSGHVEVPKSRSLDPSGIPWSVEAVVKPAQPDGTILARGGRSNGYALWLKAGHPVFTVTLGNKPYSVEAPEAVTDWTTLVGRITENRLLLSVDGRPAGATPLPGLIPHDPNDTMQLGTDLGSPVVDPPPPHFSGLIERVRLFNGPPVPARP
ncbi:MAG: sulfatase-like hydrolase/transferase [Verrucomicrobiota bacterium]|jgi:arylsulfatase A-like enzyme|nr:sulfatase-like hydrolase/transferase [Verrucomicrobiota bacterium]